MTTTLSMNPTIVADIRARLIADADAEHVQYPQYRDHWNEWVVARVTRKINQRGKVLAVGTWVLLNPASIVTAAEDDGHYWNARAIGKTFATIYFPTVKVGAQVCPGVDTTVDASKVEVLG